MNVSEHFSVIAHKDRVSGHAHVSLQIGCRPAALVFDTKTEDHWLLRSELRRISLPDHAIAIGKLGDLVGRGELAAGIVTTQWLTWSRRNLYGPYLSLRKAGRVHDIGINLVTSRRNLRERNAEVLVIRSLRMQVPEALHVRRAHKKQVHQVAVIGDQVGGLDFLRPEYFPIWCKK